MEPQKTQTIADDLREQILSGDLKPGDRLPTQTVLRQQYRTTGITIRNALAVLETELLIETRPTVGTFVRNYRRHRLEVGSGSLPAFDPAFPVLNDRLLAALITPERPLSNTLHVTRAVPPSGVAERLGTGDNEVVQRHRVFYVGDERISMSNIYFPAYLASGTPIEETENIDASLFTILEGLGAPPDDLEWELMVRTATAAESREMRWPTAMPVLVQLCCAYTGGDTPVACWVIVLPGDRLLLAERCHRKRAEIRAVS